MLLLALLNIAAAGLGPDDVVVVFNADDDAAVETATRYADARDLPLAQLCPVTGVDPTTRALPAEQATAQILTPLQDCIGALPDPTAIDAVVVVRGLPYRVDLPDGGFSVSLDAAIQIAGTVDTTTGALWLGEPQQRQGSLPIASVLNPVYVPGGVYSADMTASFGASGWYVTSPRLVRGEGVPGGYRADRAGTLSNLDYRELYIVSRLDGFDHDDARALIDRSVASDNSAPDAPIVCMRGAEGARGVRDAECEHAIRMLDAQGVAAEWVPEHAPGFEDKSVMALFTGAANLRSTIDQLDYAPGAVVENITSFGAGPRNFFCSEDGERCPESESQTSIARMIRAGATAAHGTVAEPLNNTFPNAGFLILYAQGYTLGEAFLYNQRFLYWQNLYLGDPLTAPYADRPVVNVEPESPVDGSIASAFTAEHPDGIARITVYVDGRPLAPDDDGSGRTWQDLSYAEGDRVEVLVVATAGPPAPAQVDGWPADDPVPFDPAVKGWTRAELTLSAPQPEPEPEAPEGCGCQAPITPTGPLALVALLPLLALRRAPRKTR